jgi:hypothetical protein
MFRAISFRLIAVTFSLLIAALFTEAALRIFTPSRLRYANGERDFFCRFDHELGWAPLENITGAQDINHTKFIVHQNHFGLRGPDDMQLKKTPGRNRVLVLGDSYVWGLGVDQERIFSEPAVHGTNDEIVNFGVSGYGNDQEYLFYLLKGKDFDVDQVALAFTPYNDIENNTNSVQYGHLKPYFTLDRGQLVLHNDHVCDTKVRSFFDRLNKQSLTYNLAGEGLRQLIDFFLPPRPKRWKPENITDADRAGIELTLAIFKKLKEAVEAHHAEFVVVFIPYTPHIQKNLPDNHPFVPLIAAGLTQMGVHYREPYPEFLKAAARGIHPFNDPDNHFSPAGHALFAKFVTDTEEARASTDYYAHH